MPSTSEYIAEAVSEVYEAITKVDYKINKNDADLVLQIRGIIDELRGASITGKTFTMYTPQELSKIAGNLAILKVTLGDLMSVANRNAKYAELQVKAREAAIRKPVINQLIIETKKNPTVGDIEALTRQQTIEERVIQIAREEMYEKFLNLWRSVNTLLDAIGQRIRVLMSEGSSMSKHGDNSLAFDPVDVEKADLRDFEQPSMKGDAELPPAHLRI